MSANKRARDRRRTPHTPRPSSFPGTGVIITLIGITFLLMAFSITCWALGNDPLAAVSGMGACGLVADIGRRLLGTNGHAPRQDDDRPDEDRPRSTRLTIPTQPHSSEPLLEPHADEIGDPRAGLR